MGSKGGTTVESREIDPILSEAAYDVLDQAAAASALPYIQYRGPQVAAPSPSREASKANTQTAAAAFGLDPGAGTYLPEPTTYAGGVQGYGVGDLYDQALAESIPPSLREDIDLLFAPVDYSEPGAENYDVTSRRAESDVFSGEYSQDLPQSRAPTTIMDEEDEEEDDPMSMFAITAEDRAGGR